MSPARGRGTKSINLRAVAKSCGCNVRHSLHSALRSARARFRDESSGRQTACSLLLPGRRPAKQGSVGTDYTISRRK